MKELPLYFWNGKAVIVQYGPIHRDLRGTPCVDPAHEDPEYRYGVFHHDGWDSRRLETFPKEFRMHLLLLGVA